MAAQDLDSIYRERRSPWPVLALLLVIAVAVAAFFIFRNRLHSRSSEPAAASDAPSAAAAPAVESAPAPTSPMSLFDGIESKAAEAAPVVAPAKDVPVFFSLPDGPIDPKKLPLSKEFQAAWKVLKDAGDAAGERALFVEALAKASAADRPVLEAVLGRLNFELYTMARPAPGKVSHIIKSGDSLAKLADTYVCPVTLIQKMNGIKDAAIVRLNQRVVLLDHPKFEVLVSKSANTLTLRLNGAFFKKYLVGTGAYASTPTGTFKLYDKIEHPSWWTADGRSIPFGDPENILGTHWLSLEATGDTEPVSGIGIHGTWKEETLGKQSSAGCVRMRNKDVEELFTMLPRGTPVKVVD